MLLGWVSIESSREVSCESVQKWLAFSPESAHRLGTVYYLFPFRPGSVNMAARAT